jgi:hypothetical protein
MAGASSCPTGVSAPYLVSGMLMVAAAGALIPLRLADKKL